MEGKQTAPVFFVSAVLCAILCAIFPFAGFVTVIVLPAVFGVCLAASFSLPVALSPLPGIVIAGLLWRSPSVSVCGLVLFIPAAFLCVFTDFQIVTPSSGSWSHRNQSSSGKRSRSNGVS